MLYNDPSNSDPLPSYRDIPPTPQLLGNVKERYVRPNDEPEADMDEDDVRTRRYWKRWGGRAAKELVRTINRERTQKQVRRREPIYSARVREPVYRKESDSSSDSDGTGISLLTTSSVRLTDLGKVKFAAKKSPRRRSSAKAREPEVKRVYWELRGPLTNGYPGKFIAKGYSDEEIAAIAEHLSRLKEE